MKYLPLIPLSLLIFAPLLVSSYALSLLVQVLIFGILAMSLNLLIGHTGLISFNHATFFGLGAYAAGILSVWGYDNFWLALCAGIVIPMMAAAFLGLLIFRSSGPYFFILTLAFGQLAFAAAWKWRSLTGGDDGLPGISRPDPGLPVSFADDAYFYYMVLVFFILSYSILRTLVRSHFGRALAGIREGEGRMQAMGYNTWAYKYAAYIAAAGFGGLGGVLNAWFKGIASPHDMNWTMSGMIVLMVIIGGSGSLAGPVLGAGIIIFLQYTASSYTERWPFITGVVFVLCVLYVREGIAGVITPLFRGNFSVVEKSPSENKIGTRHLKKWRTFCRLVIIKTARERFAGGRKKYESSGNKESKKELR